MANNPITSQDLYQPGPQDELKLLHARLAQLQMDIKNMTTLARTLKKELLGIRGVGGSNSQNVTQLALQVERLRQSLERTRQAQLRTQAQLQRLTAAQNQAAASANRLSISQSQAAAAALRLQNLQNRATASTNSHRTSLTGLIGSIRNLAYAYFSLGAAAQVFQNILKQTKALDTLTVAFNTTLGSTQATAQAQEYLLDISERFGTNLLGASQAYLKFSAASTQAGVSAEETQKIFTSVTKASSILGLGAERTSYVFLALEQIMSKGRLSTEELRRQLGEHLPGAFGIAAEAMGVTTAKLTDMLKKGEIASTDFLPKFAKQLERAYGLEQVERIDNLAAAQERFNNELTLLVRDLDLSGVFKDFFNTLASGVRFVRENTEAFLALGKAILYVGIAWAAWKIGAAITGMGSLTKAVQALNLAMKANPIGVVLVATTALVASIDILSKKFDSATLSRTALNNAIKDGVDNTKIQKIQTDRLVEAYGREQTSNEEKAKILKTLQDMGVDIIDQNKDKVISNDEVTSSVERYISRLRLQAEMESLTSELTNLSSQRRELQNKDISGAGRFANITDRFLGTTFSKEGVDAAIQQIDDAETKVTDRLKELYDKINNATPESIDPLAPTAPEDDPNSKKNKFNLERELNALIFDERERELDLLRINYEEKFELFKKNKVDTLALEQKYRDDTVDILNKYIDIEDNAELDQAERQKKRFKSATDDVKKYFDARRQAAEDAETRRKFSVDTLRNEFNARREHEQALFDLSKHTEEEKKAFALRLQAEELNDEIQLHRIFGKVLNDEELARAIELRDKIKAQFSKDGKLIDGGDKKDGEIDIFSLLNINFDSPEKKEALIDALDFAKQQLTDFLDFQKEIIDQEIENADRKVRAAEENLNRQIALQTANQANNVAGAQAELALAKKSQEEALKQRQKFQKQELALNTALEASNLTLAIAKTLKEFPGPVGIALAATMIAAFAAAKIKAFQLANKKTFRKGGFKEIGGGSHESGNDTHVGGNNYAENGESVGIFTAKATRKYKPSLKALVNAANKGTLENILVQDRRAIQGINLINKTDIDTSLMEKRLTRLVSLSESKTFVDGKGRLVRMDRGRTTIINR